MSKKKENMKEPKFPNIFESIVCIRYPIVPPLKKSITKLVLKNSNIEDIEIIRRIMPELKVIIPLFGLPSFNSMAIKP
jgi:hypothetical protein